MKKTLRAMMLTISAVLAVGNLTMLTDAQSANLAERISEETIIWGNHTIVSDVFTEIEDPTILPESKRDSVDAIQVEDRMCGLAFRVNGALPEMVGNYNIHYFQDYFPYDQNQYDIFEEDSAGCFIASYAWYESYLENMFPVPWYKEEPINIRFTDGDEVELSDTDSVVILMLGQYPSDVQADMAAEETYFLDVEKELSACEQFSYIGEARRIEQTFYYNMDGLDIVCTDADAAKELLDSDLLASYSAKHILRSNPCVITLPELFTDEARELRALVRQDERVLSAQINYSAMADAGADIVMNGIFTLDIAPAVTTETTVSSSYDTETTTQATSSAEIQGDDSEEITTTALTTTTVTTTALTTTALTTTELTTTALTTTESALPQTGNNSPARILALCGALLLISSGAWTFIIARRKENIS